MKQEINKELKHYIEKKVFPMYAMGTEEHNLMHIYQLINNSLKIARERRANLNMIFLLAAYNDIAPLLGTKISIKYDMALKQWFTEEEIQVMEEILNQKEVEEIEILEDSYDKHKIAPMIKVYKSILQLADKNIQSEKTLGLSNNHNRVS